MFFFISGLFLSMIISGALLAGLFRALRINWERKNKRPISYLSPVLLTVVLLVLSIGLMIPRLLDIVPLVTGALDVAEIRADAAGIGYNVIQDGNRRFSYNQWKFDILPGRVYQITYTPRSLVIIDVMEIIETTDAGQ